MNHTASRVAAGDAVHERARFLDGSRGDHVSMLWLAILTPSAAAAAVICLVYALTSAHQ